MHPLNSQIALLTKHQKLQQIAPAFAKVWQGDIQVYDQFDTDSLGSFDNTITRELPPDQCAIKKALLACEFTGLSQGLGSEGSFSGYAGIGNMNEECIAFIDKSEDIAVVGVYRQMILLSPIHATDENQLLEKLSKHPEQQGWMLIDNAQNEIVIEKGLIGAEQIIQSANSHYPIDITPDFRAMMCPERQINIAKAAEDLLMRLNSHCPSCSAPDFVFDKVETGLPCELCGTPTNQVARRVADCKKCGHSENQPVAENTGSSFYCNICNP